MFYNNKLKILFISRRFYPDIIGGGQISAFYIAKAVSKFHNVYICTFTDDKLKEDLNEKIDNLNIRRYYIKKLFFSKKLSNLDYMYWQISKISSKMINEIKPDIIHLLNFESIPFTSIYLKKKFNLPIIATVNGPNFGCFIGTGIDYRKETCINCKFTKRPFCSVDRWGLISGLIYYGYSLWYMNLLKLSYKYVDKFIAISNAMIPLLNNMKVRDEKIAVIYNPIGEIHINNKLLKKLKKKYNKKKILLCASRLAEEKGIQISIEVMKYLDEKYILFVAGTGQYESKLKKLASHLNVSKKVIFLGKISQSDLFTYYKISNLFLHFPYIYESFGRTLIEAMSQGCPSVVYPIAGINDIINEKNGLIIKSRDPKKIAVEIDTLLKDNARYKKLKINCKKDIKKYDNKKIAMQYIKEYEKLIK